MFETENSLSKQWTGRSIKWCWKWNYLPHILPWPHYKL